VIAYDRPAFGLSERPMPGEWQGESPYGYDAQVDLLIRLMDALGVEKAVLVGNSMGGSIAALAAQTYPDRVQALVLVAAANEGHGVPPLAGGLAASPQLRRLGPLFVRQNVEGFAMQVLDASWHDPSRIPAQTVAEYRKALQVKNWDRALWELIAAARPFEMLLRPDQIDVPTLVIVGGDDRVIGTETVVTFGEQIPDVEIHLIENCGHVPQEECPEEFVEAIRAYGFSD
jgi:pimeloyl-ACP methyl ester carboxylesterase